MVAEELELPFIEEEAEAAVFSMGSDKSSRPDGYSTLFFKEFWTFIKGEMMDLFQELYEGTLDISRMNGKSRLET